MKKGLLIWLLMLSGINFYTPQEVFFLVAVVLLIIGTTWDRALYFNSSLPVLLPLILLVAIGMVRGMGNMNKDYYRDVIIFSKNIVYFLAGIALSKYLKDFNTFFRYFFALAFFGAIIHIGTILTHLNQATSLETIRYVAGYENSIEGVVLALYIARMFNKDFKKLIKDLPRFSTIMIGTIGISFMLYFSRSMIVTLIVLCFFLCNLVYIRKIFTPQNAKVFRASIVGVAIFYLVVLIASFGPADSPLQRLVDKFEDIPQEVSWDAQRNASATLEDINNNWRGYEAYQGILKYRNGSDLQKALGYGFNARVDLGIIMKLAGEDYDKVPILHNQYVTLLVKTGFIGLLLYLAFLYMAGMSKIKYNKDDHTEIYYSFQMLSGLSITSLLNTYIGFGLLAFGVAAIPAIMGFCFGNAQRHKYAVEEIKTNAVSE